MPRKMSRVISSVYVGEPQITWSSRLILTLRKSTTESEDA